MIGGPLLNIQTTPALLGLNTTPWEMQITRDPPDLEVNSSPAQVQIENPSVSIDIDNSAPREEIGLGTPAAAARRISASNRQQGEQSVARLAQKGDRLMRQPGAIPAIALQEQRMAGRVETTLAALPQSRPRITVPEPTMPKISFTAPEVQISVNPQEVNIAFTPAVVQAYLRQKHSISIDYTGSREIWV